MDAFIALSRFSADKHAEFGFERPMTVMPSFLPDAPVEAAAAPAVPGRPYFLFVGRLERIKGLHDVIPAFDDASPADLLVAGAGTDEPALRALAAGRPRVHFLGEQTADRLGALYRGARALIAPSVGYEVFPLVVLEAFQQGTPVIRAGSGPIRRSSMPAGAACCSRIARSWTRPSGCWGRMWPGARRWARPAAAPSRRTGARRSPSAPTSASSAR